MSAALAVSQMEIETSSDLVGRMEMARSRIEERFLEGGAALLAILDILNKLLASLDQATGSLDEDAAEATMAELRQTMESLAGLRRAEDNRQACFGEIATSRVNLRPHVEDMQETLRYLRTFAITAKIAGASIPDFAGFAEEIVQRIQDGTNQVNEFSGNLRVLGQGLDSVIPKGRGIVEGYDRTMPPIIQGLSGATEEIGRQRKVLKARALEVRDIARAIQNKLASTLSAMQIGDITRQRIEHCQSTLTLLAHYLSSPEAAALDIRQRDGVSAVFGSLVSLQLEQSMDDFDRDTAKIVQTVASFRSDLGEIEAIRRSMADDDGSGEEGAMHQLEAGVGAAREAVQRIEAVAAESLALSRSTARTVGDLLKNIGVVQLVRTDINYMALNTNLRCSKIGEEGRAINVVTSELRTYAAQLDTSADQVLDELTSLERASERLAREGAENDRSLDERLAKAMANITEARDRMDGEMAALGEQSRTAVADINHSLGRLDFKAELGEVLRACAEDSRRHGEAVIVDGTQDAIAELAGRIARLYTMVSERELHARVLGTAPPVEAPVVAAIMSDDDIEDALF